MNRADEVFIEQALREKIERMIDEEASEAADRVAARIRAAAGHMAIELLEQYSIERHGSELRITVKAGGVA